MEKLKREYLSESQRHARFTSYQYGLTQRIAGVFLEKLIGYGESIESMVEAVKEHQSIDLKQFTALLDCEIDEKWLSEYITRLLFLSKSTSFKYFHSWIVSKKDEHTPTGDLARDIIADKNFPIDKSFIEMGEYIEISASKKAFEVFNESLIEFLKETKGKGEK